MLLLPRKKTDVTLRPSPAPPAIPARRKEPPPDLPRSDTRRLIFWGAVLLVLHMGVIGTWAATVPLRSAVIADGFIKVLSKRKAVQHFEGGNVRTVYVQETQLVEEGQLLARIDTTQMEAELAALEAKLYSDLATDARLVAEQINATSISFPEELRSKAFHPDVKLALRSQEAEFAARNAALTGERTVIDQQIRQLEHTIRGLHGKRKGLEQQIASLREEIRDGDYLMEKGLARKPRVLALKRAHAEAESMIERDAAAIAESQTKIAELQDRRRQLDFNRRQEIAKLRQETNASIAELRHRISAVRDRIARSELRAPERGVVVGLNTRAINAVLGPRETLLEIVPVQDRLVVEANLKPSDRNEVYPGQTARVRVLAFNIRRTPILTGTVMNVSADALIDPKANIASYRTEIELHSNAETAPYLSALQPGMPIEAFIETGERTFSEYLLQPIILRVGRAFKES